MQPRRGSLVQTAAQDGTATNGTHMDDSLFHVSQRLDALAADDEHAYLYFSRVVTPPLAEMPASSVSSSSGATTTAPGRRISIINHRQLQRQSHRQHHHQPQQQQQQHQQPHRTRSNTVTIRRQRRRKAWYQRLSGLSAFYLRFVALLGVGWFVFGYVFISTALVLPSSPPQLLTGDLSQPEKALATQFARELAALAIGSAVGGLVFGSVADHHGRRSVLLAATACGVASQVASGFAWCHLAIVAARALIGLGLGGQLVLVPIVLSEFTAQRLRGRVVILSMAFVALGGVAAIHSAQLLVDLLNWKLFTSAVCGSLNAIVFVFWFAWLRESPRFLAAIGRLEAAMRIVECIEGNHGISRNARITMPTSLFEPPLPQQQHHQHHLHQDDASLSLGMSRTTMSTATNNGMRMEDQRNRELSGDSQTMLLPAASTMSAAQRRRRRSSTALTPGMISIGASIRKRWKRVLWCRPYVRRSVGLALLWVLVAGGLSVTIACAARFSSVGDDRSVLLTCISGAAFIGCILSAAIIDGAARVPMLSISLLASSLATTMIGMHLYMELGGSLFLSVACSLLALSCVVSLSTTIVWTLENYGVLIRATGVGFAFTGSCLSVASGQWLAWSTTLITSSVVHFVIWGIAGAWILVALVVWAVGIETHNQDDVDSVVMEQTDPYPTATAPGATSYERSSSEKLTAPLRSTYHSKASNANIHHHDSSDLENATGILSTDESDDPAMDTPPTSSSAGSTFVGSSISRTSSGARRSSVRFSSQQQQQQRGGSGGRPSRTASSNSGTNGTRGSSLNGNGNARQSVSATYRRREASGGSGSSGSTASTQRSLSSRSEVPVAMRRSSSQRSDHQYTPQYVTRRSSLTRGPPVGGDPMSPVTRVRMAPPPPHRQQQATADPGSSFGTANRLSFSHLTTSLPERLDPHSVRERFGRRSSEDESSSSCKSEDLSEHDVMTIDIDPFDSGRFVPMLG